MYESVQLKMSPKENITICMTGMILVVKKFGAGWKQSDYQATLTCLVFVQCLWKNFC